MLDWLVVWGVKNAFGFVFKTLLEKLAREDLKKYTQNFFAQILRNFPSDIGIRQKERLEIVFGQALKEFLLQVQQQLEDAELSEAELKQYINSLQQFIHQEAALLELGKPFLPDAIPDADTLAAIWDELKLRPLPADFNWQSLTRRYTKKVKAILRESDELDFILDAQNIAVIQQNIEKIAGIVPDFDLMRYRAEIQKFYGHLRLDSFDTSGYSYSLKLWNMFVAQNVREVNEALPQVYELPKEHLKRLQRSGQLAEDFDIQPEILEQYKRSYTQQSSRSVLEVIDESQTGKYLVILGDPGSGKSSLLQYLTLQWAETPIQDISSLSIPLLIELRTYVRSRDNQECRDFLEFFQQGSGFICSLNQYQLDSLLKTGKAFVMFDGLDEVFEPSKREKAITDIINFTHNYPLVRVLVTSRVIGYQPQRLRDISFRHFMLQDLELEQIQEFINRWHNFAFSDPLEKQRKKERLERAIQDYPAIRQLAVNPLLLTMMAILNRNQELPRDRSELYSQASRVLLQQWDLEKLLIQVESATIDYKDKQGMLRQVAYRMQTSEKGLAGNLINKDDLEKILIEYLYSIEVHQGEKIAQLIIEQLRERNFILCFLGADYYAFVHRTFLEYFCAWEFVWQFEKERSITIEFLKTEVFGKHWQDETWHEVLLLIAGMIDAKFVGEILDYLMLQDGEEEKFINLFLAAKCLAEVRNRSVIASVANKLLNKLQDLTKYDLWYYYRPYKNEETKLVQEIRTQAVVTIAAIWKDNYNTLHWLKDRASVDKSGDVRYSAIEVLASNFKDDPDTYSFLIKRATADNQGGVRRAAIEALASNFKDDPDTYSFLKDRASVDKSGDVRYAAIEALASNFKDDPYTYSFLINRATADNQGGVRRAAIEALASNFKDDPDTYSFLKDRASVDKSGDVRYAAIEALASNFKDDPDTHSFIKNRATTDKYEDVRRAAIQALASNFPDDPDTCSILKHRATDDNAWNVRYTAIQLLASNFPDDQDTHSIFKDLATADKSGDVRRAAIQALASNFQDNPDAHSFLKDRATADNQRGVRRAAIEVLASNFQDDPDTRSFLKDCATADNEGYVRGAAIQALASNFSHDPDTRSFLKERATADNEGYVRGAAIQALASNFSHGPDTHWFLKERATADDDGDVQRAAIQALAKHFRNQPELFEIYYNCAVNGFFEGSHDPWQHPNPRRVALEIIIKQFPQHPQTLPLLRDKAENDPDEKVRKFAQQKLAELEK
ncbi:MAG: HEAT repeat domain-containing protein [Nostoc sp.]|uniref:HEAT repeat domain-containing protein n=2 Tax=Nostoc sp. TaxID=1180 RepID=UPI002FF78AB0